MRRSTVLGLSVLLGVAFAVGAELLPRSALAQKAEPMPPAKGKQFELRPKGGGAALWAIRFNVTTGESWMIAGGEAAKIPESGPVPAGDYDVLIDKDSPALRIDRGTGATWYLKTDPEGRTQWIKVKERGQKEK
jgi:hypothetical protein